ncbi:MAG: EAL domain-containing protein [Ruminiclostridium sp.]|nr:EAL domain-containing protein [Ruminiclostridium sp.]
MQKDLVTGLMKFEDFLAEAQYIVRNGEKKHLILAFDVCDFHYINNQYGYDKGDLILKDIGEVISGVGDFVILCCREYSDHFVCLCSYDGDENSFINVKLKEIELIFTEKFEDNEKDIYLNLNFGVYFFNNREESIISAVDKANVARRTGKGNHNIPCVVYSEHLMDIKENSAKIIPVFNDSFKNERILVYLQPKICSETQMLVGAEALSRLVDKDGNMISPALFIPALEKTGKIVELDFYVLNFILKLIRSWLDKGIEPVTISFNLSRIHFFSDSIVDDIIGMAEYYKVPAKYVEIEVTESVFFEEENVIIEKVEKLREYGFKVSVDDFGAGYSSLNLIGVLPVDIIKLDKGFVKGSLKTKRGNDVIKGLIKILNEIELDIVCEGVETKEEETIISNYGCKEIQGYLYDRPIPVSEFEKKYLEA